MQITIASGKGGTGKTTVALGLALTGGNLNLIDTDVEEPNCQILLRGEPAGSERVSVMVPAFDEGVCTRCGSCARVCRFNALAVGPQGHLLFPELCHGCGACLMTCQRGAVKESKREIGSVNRFVRGGIRLFEGCLDVGESTGVPLIRQLRNLAAGEESVIADAPPGTSCGMVAAVAGADYCLLVTEPTLFGRHDLALALSVAASMGVPAGVAINRSGEGDELIEDLCRERGVPILARIPFDRRLAEEYASGDFGRHEPRFAGLFRELWRTLRQEVGRHG